MGRAIVRSPKAFLMDEPLSNLDAKLRVQMRTEVSRIQQRLGTTTVYVTHDQIEAMTLGDRVAVMRGGVIQQVDTPKDLYEKPEQPVRGRLHRLAVDELPARRGWRATRSSCRSARRRSPTTLRSRLAGDGKPREVIAGVRPEHFEDAQRRARQAGPARSRRTCRSWSRWAPSCTPTSTCRPAACSRPSSSELAGDAGIPDLPRHGGDEQQVVARLDAASRARPGEQVELVLDATSMQLFDPNGGAQPDRRTEAAAPAATCAIRGFRSAAGSRGRVLSG